MATIATTAAPASTFVVIEPESSALGCIRDPHREAPLSWSGPPLWPVKAARFLKRLLPPRSTSARTSIPPRSDDDLGYVDDDVIPVRHRAAAPAAAGDYDESSAHVIEPLSHTLDGASLASALAVIGMLTGVTFVTSVSSGIVTIGLPRITEELGLPESLMLWSVRLCVILPFPNRARLGPPLYLHPISPPPAPWWSRTAGSLV